MKTEKIYTIGQNPLRITPSNFVHKSLCQWAMNICVGCQHGCRFCFVPGVSTNRRSKVLAKHGIKDPDAEWGRYVLLRPWDEKQFLQSLLKAELMPDDKLNEDGHRAVMYCTTTDPYQTFSGTNNAHFLNDHRRMLVRRSLKLIRDCSSLRVRILTRSPLAEQDFDLYKSFGDRLVFGMSIASLDDSLVRCYEPSTPSVKRRIETLTRAKDAGLNIYVAVAPTYPECGESELREILDAVVKLKPACIYHEPINIRARNVERMQAEAKKQGKELKLEVFESSEATNSYAIDALMTFQRLAREMKVEHKLKLWPDPILGSRKTFLAARRRAFEQLNASKVVSKEAMAEFNRQEVAAFARFKGWLDTWWSRIAPWPGVDEQSGWVVPELLPCSPFSLDFQAIEGT